MILTTFFDALGEEKLYIFVGDLGITQYTPPNLPKNIKYQPVKEQGGNILDKSGDLMLHCPRKPPHFFKYRFLHIILYRIISSTKKVPALFSTRHQALWKPKPSQDFPFSRL